MKTMKYFLIYFLLPISMFGQQFIEDYYSLIDNKIKTGQLLNIYVVNKHKFANNINVDLKGKDINGALNKYKSVKIYKSLINKSAITEQYILGFLKANNEITKPNFDPPELLFLAKERIVKKGGGFNKITSYDTTFILTYKDMCNLKHNSKADYKKIRLSLINSSKYKNATKYKDDIPVKENELSGHTKITNEYYLLDKRANSKYHKPPIIETNSKFFSSQTEGSLWKINASFSNVVFRSRWMKQILGNSSDNDGLSFELGSYEELLNVLPWQSSSFTLGARTLINFGNVKELVKKSYADIAVKYKFRVNTVNVFDNLPFAIGDDQKINTGNRIVFDIDVAKPFGLPDLHFYLATGGETFKDPYVEIADKDYSYFTTTQASTLMSFSWGYSYGKSEDVFRLKMDLGAGYYDLFKVYNEDNFSDMERGISPQLNFHINYVSDANSEAPVEKFGSSIKYFDSVLKFNSWFRLFDLTDISHLRFEVLSQTSPLGREIREWEVGDGVFIQFRYMYNY